MDRYAARLLLTAVMFGAVAISATLFSDIPAQAAGSEPLPAAVYRETAQQTQTNTELYCVSVCTQQQAEAFVTVLNEDGYTVGNWWTDEEGCTVIGPLAPGTYYAKGKYTGYAKFTLADNAAVSVQAGYGWADGELLHLTDFEPSRLELTCTQGKESGIVTLTLKGVDGQSIERTGYLRDGTAELTFDGLQKGRYTLCQSDAELQTAEVDGCTSLTVALPHS